GMHFVDIFTPDARHRAGGEHVGHNLQAAATEVGDAAGDDFAVPLEDADGGILIANDFAGIDGRFEQVTDTETAGDAGEIGADEATLVVEAMASGAGDRAIQLAAFVEVPLATEAALDDRH